MKATREDDMWPTHVVGVRNGTGGWSAVTAEGSKPQHSRVRRADTYPLWSTTVGEQLGSSEVVWAELTRT